MNPPVCMCLCMYICASLEGLCHFAQSLQLIKTCSISCLSICLLISGSYAFRSHLTGNLLPYYSCRLRLFPVTLIFIFFLLHICAAKSGKTSSLSVLMLGTHCASRVPRTCNCPSSRHLRHPPLHRSHVHDMGVVCLLCVRCNDVG